MADYPPPWTRKLWLGPNEGAPAPASDTDIPKPAPNVIPHSDISLPPPSNHDVHDLAPATMLHRGNLVPGLPFIKPQNLGRSSLPDPFIASADPQFELLVHPDYRPPPPRPFLLSKDKLSSSVHSPLDYIPTGTISFFDLIFAIRRRPDKKPQNPPLNLQALVIEIPVSENQCNGREWQHTRAAPGRW